MGGADAAQVISGFQTPHPGQFVQVVQLLAVRSGQVQIQRLALVYPFLPARGGLDQPARIDFEGGGVELFQICRDAVDALHAAVVVFKIVDHDLVP